MRVKEILRAYIPENILIGYHFLKAYCAAMYYGFPGKKMHVIGITGTKGKTTSANLIWAVLTSGEYKTGLIGTANIRIGEKEEVNRLHMTMPGPWIVQKLLKDMYSAGCTHVVMEVPSEGLKLYRHTGINFEVGIFTNLSPEHLASHGGSFEKYKQMKGRLFALLSERNGTTAIINADSEHASYYSSFPVTHSITYGIEKGKLRAEHIIENKSGVSFSVNGTLFNLNILGAFNVYNALSAIAVGQTYNIPDNKIRDGLLSIDVIPGRMELIDEGQPFTVIVDYAHEQLSINTLLDTASRMTEGNIIVLIGGEGGGRDKQKREHMGRASGIKAHYVIVTTTDPYDEDPKQIAEEIAKFSEQAGKIRDKTLFVEIDRRSAITKAFTIANPGDIVLCTGMGAQETMMMGGETLPWDERKIVRELLVTYMKKHDS